MYNSLANAEQTLSLLICEEGKATQVNLHCTLMYLANK